MIQSEAGASTATRGPSPGPPQILRAKPPVHVSLGRFCGEEPSGESPGQRHGSVGTLSSGDRKGRRGRDSRKVFEEAMLGWDVSAEMLAWDASAEMLGWDAPGEPRRPNPSNHPCRSRARGAEGPSRRPCGTWSKASSRTFPRPFYGVSRACPSPVRI